MRVVVIIPIKCPATRARYRRVPLKAVIVAEVARARVGRLGLGRVGEALGEPESGRLW